MRGGRLPVSQGGWTDCQPSVFWGVLVMRRVSAALAALICATVLTTGTAVAADGPDGRLTPKEEAGLRTAGQVMDLLLGGAR